jgi:acetyl-CoA synthetase
MAEDDADLETHLTSGPQFEPPASFVGQANVADPDIYDAFERDWPDCWSRAADLLDWEQPYDSVLGGAGGPEEPPFEWFAGGELNAAANCVDRHVAAGRKNQAAIKWEGRLGETRTLTYLDLYRELNAFAAALGDLGVEEDDVVTVYLPMIPELPVAMLACARIGAPHNVVFAGFSADALAERMDRADSDVLVTCDGYYRRGTAVNQKRKADNARHQVDADVTTVVVDRLGEDMPLAELGDREYAYDDLQAAHAGSEVDPVPRASDDTLFLIHTSGTTGRPKAVEHLTGGYLPFVAWTSRAVLDIKSSDTYWCSADIGWITGHSYIVYGPLSLGATTMMYEGTPDHPEKNRVWEIIERNAVDVFYTAPTAVRAFMKWGSEYPEGHDLSSLRLLGTVGEPINPRAWKWYYEHIGNEECPVVDTWWQTETGGIVISTLPGVSDMKPGSAGPPLPGIDACVVDRTGEEVAPGEAGHLVLTRPWPGMPRTLAAGEDWSGSLLADRIDGWAYVSEDGATVDEDGYLTLLGRVDDVVNVSGHRLGTMEIESAIVGVEGVAEAAVVAGHHETSGNAIYAYVSVADNWAADDRLRARIHKAIETAIGPIARPEAVVFTPELPKTRSGKIMRRLLERVANGEELGDTSALRNPEVVGELEAISEESE